MSGANNNNLWLNSPNQHSTQIWEGVADSARPGFFFIQSSQPPDQAGNSIFIGIKGITEATANDADGSLLNVNVMETGWHQNQLWTVALDPEGQPNEPSFILIQSFLTDSSGTPLVFDIEGWAPGTTLTAKDPNTTSLDAFHQKTNSTRNQRWVIQGLQVDSPRITAFIPNINIIAPKGLPSEESTVTVTGTGFPPGTTLLITPQFYNEATGLFQPNSFLAVSDLAGNISVSASLPTWGLGVAYPDGVSWQDGVFRVGVAYNGPGNPPTVAGASATWSGTPGFSDFKSAV
jgi:hypothetical protein